MTHKLAIAPDWFDALESGNLTFITAAKAGGLPAPGDDVYVYEVDDSGRRTGRIVHRYVGTVQTMRGLSILSLLTRPYRRG